MTEFICKLCNKLVKFDPNDESSYLQRVPSGNPLIGRLFTYRVPHRALNGRLHINVVVVDPDGNYRAHKDYYEEQELAATASSQWRKAVEIFPDILRPYLLVADMKEQQELLASYHKNEMAEWNVTQWTDFFLQLWDTYPENNFFSFIAALWCYFVGKMEELVKRQAQRHVWSYLIIIRALSRINPSKDLKNEIHHLEELVKEAPQIIELERYISAAEVLLRLSEIEELKRIYTQAMTRLSILHDLISKTVLLTVQAYYGFSQFQIGNLSEAKKLVEPAYLFAQLIENKLMLKQISIFYGIILRSTGELTTARQVFATLQQISHEFHDERTRIVAVMNLAIVESLQGNYEKALSLHKMCLEEPLVKKELHLRIPVLNNIAQVLYEQHRYEEAMKYAKEGLAEKNLPIEMQIALYGILKSIARAQRSKELLEWIEERLPSHPFFETPRGRIFLEDLRAIEAEINYQWKTAIKHLENQLKIIEENNLKEQANVVELNVIYAYYMLYRQEKDPTLLKNLFRHISRANTLAQEAGYYPDLCRLTYLKGLIAIEAQEFEQAEIHLNDALKLARQYELKDLEAEITEFMETFREQQIEQMRTHINKLFKNLKLVPPPQKAPPQRELQLLWIYSKTVDWEILMQTVTPADDEHENQTASQPTKIQRLKVQESSTDLLRYFQGIKDVWKYCERNILSNNISQIPSQYGNLLVESTEQFVLLAICTKLHYALQMKLQRLLNELENFSFNKFSDELTAFTASKVKKLFGEMQRINL